MTAIQEFALLGMNFIQEQMGSHTFTWLVDNNQYPCYASVQNFKRELESGGFSIDLFITMTVPLFDMNDNPTFSGAQPTAEQKINYNGQIFRIANVAQDTIGTGARLRITGYSPFKGV